MEVFLKTFFFSRDFKIGAIYFFVLIFFLFFKIFPVQALTVSPPLFKIEAEKGTAVTKKIKVFNETNQPLTIYSSIENFEPDKNTGLPVFLGNSNFTNLAQWISVEPQKISLPSGESKEAQVIINIPETAEPGGHYAAIFWTEAPLKDAGVQLVNRLGSLILLNVSGVIKEELKIVDFRKNENNSFFLQIENSGNTHLEPSGQIKIFNSDNEQISLLPVNSVRQNILPQSRRNFSLSGANLKWGKYSAKAQLYFGKDKSVESQTITFWVWPQNLFYNLAGIAAVILVIFVIYKMAKKRFLRYER
ncbi:MAG: hypothetical protein UT86_C0004G0003 [Candidatus Magasanikbacteria bacterium GW2011_GWC2_40_17]|uniref:DUF916 domain-containing protein n=1 Tax=Candidatus Magasanikbacteria bacterium GW2011_GWA2_42_32 TaxID=1619039 RepID=A0A0G1D4V9_9BACT|nr:MAG: hypothetical protein UT86_C0004G0003 [Candidatus Magasanikbacteria bacterium GW2011_GWC2_40_17]KKS57063.1 MAG: hypothetical protein UV20_C0003G0003 [Candidatus Magasanikbacteria bacterium GW2011_GWA2_42_32]OGH85409.1 MAG: hypothetical protein A2294_01460 [Candidatus Magasanikbacteria bacterium RIFOXYB2_FULL_38_10]